MIEYPSHAVLCVKGRLPPTIMSSSAMDDVVTMDEIRDFRTSMSARRFPALRDLRDEDVAALVLAERKARATRAYNAKPPMTSSPRRTRRLTDSPDLDKVSPRSALVGAGGSEGRPVLKKAPPFSPANPFKARDDITRAGKNSQFASVGTPYDVEVFRYIPNEEILPFVPASAAEAKKKVAVNYYLNSPDAETQEVERVTIAMRSANSISRMRQEMKWDRGHKPSRHKIVVPGALDAGERSGGVVGGVETPARKETVQADSGEPVDVAEATDGEAVLAQLSADAAEEEQLSLESGAEKPEAAAE